MPQLSVVVITLNEERNLRRCLQSVRDIADEIVVVDSFSTDETEKIAKSFNARFIQHPFEDYVKQHEFADLQASFNHILSIDADEALSEKLSHSIQQVKKDWKHDGYYMNRMTNYCGKWIKHSGWYPDRKLRIFDRRKGRWVGKRIHEKFSLSKETTTGLVEGDLLHYSFHSIFDHVKQANHFTDLTAKAAFERGEKSNFLKILINPVFKFVRNYCFNLGFLDGYYGFIVCQISANATFLKYVKLKQLQKKAKAKK